jgi:DNA-directed RNA polymerase subunit RPC12/RpoP
MELVLRNPFRILGLPVTASSREVAKRVSDLEMFAELGKHKKYLSDLAAIGEIDRSLDSIKDAARRIELPEMRVFYSFFWFHSGDAVDELALECLENFELLEADNVWSKQLEKQTGIGKASWRINRGVYSVWMADELKDSGTAHFEQALQDIAFASEDLYAESTKSIPGASQVSSKKIRELIADALVGMAVNSQDQVYGPNAIKVLQHCFYFHEKTLEYIAAKLTNPLANAVRDAVNLSKLRRDQGTSIDDLRRKNGLSKVEKFVYALRDSLGETDSSFQAIANCFADEVIACAVNAINKHEAVQTAIVLAEWAAELPAYGQSRKWLMEQRRKILNWDSDYVPEEEPEDDLADIEAELEPDDESEEEIEPPPSPKIVPTRTTVCPRCKSGFQPSEVLEYTIVGVRCPHCNQSIVL